MSEQVFYNCKSAAKYLGQSIASFYRLKAKHPVFQPFKTKYSGGPRYHIEQLKLISGVILGELNPDDALSLWEAKKTVIALEPSA